MGFKMKFTKTTLDSSFLISPEPFKDHRGFFNRVYCQNEFSRFGLNKPIVQINHSMTVQKGSIRGMHYQLPPFSETKIVKCIKGRIFDVIIDLRKDSPTFLQWFGAELSSNNMQMLIVPDGFAHGFQSLDDNVEIIYMVTQFYNKASEKGIRYNDPNIGIKWPLEVTDLSDKDKNHPDIKNSFDGI
jgi:dTDP-4-dehydrorhamnose 3,5-epimerase